MSLAGATTMEAVAESASAASPAPQSSGIGTVPLVIIAVGIAGVVLACGLGSFIYIRRRNPAFALRIKASLSPLTRRNKQSVDEEKGMVIGEPELRFAPEHVAHAINLKTATDAEKMILSKGESFGGPATLARVFNGLAASSSMESNTSGPIPRTSSESDGQVARRMDGRKSSASVKRKSGQRTSTDAGNTLRPERRSMRRAAVPSTLLRSLGNLDIVPTFADTRSNPSESISSVDTVPRLSEVIRSSSPTKPLQMIDPQPAQNSSEEPPSFGSSAPFDDELDFETKRSAWLANTLSATLDRFSFQAKSQDIPSVPQQPPRDLKPLAQEQSMANLSADASNYERRPSLATSVHSQRSVASSYVTSRAAGSVYESVASLGHASSSRSLVERRGSDHRPEPAVPSVPTHLSLTDDHGEENLQDDCRLSASHSGDLGEKEAIPEMRTFRPLSLGLGFDDSSSTSLVMESIPVSRRSSGIAASEDDEVKVQDTLQIPALNASFFSASSLQDRRPSDASSAYIAASIMSKSTEVMTAASDIGETSFNSVDTSLNLRSEMPSLLVSDISIDTSRSLDTVVTSVDTTHFATPEVSHLSLIPPQSSPAAFEKHASAQQLAPNFVRSKSPGVSPKLGGLVSPYHHAVFPESPLKEAKDVKRASRRREELLAQLAIQPDRLSPKLTFTETLRIRLSKHSLTTSPQMSPILPSETNSLHQIRERPGTMSTMASTSFGPASEQWKVSTDDADEEEPPFITRKAEGRSGLGVNMSSLHHAPEQSPVAARLKGASASPTFQRTSMDGKHVRETSTSFSPIMQASKWSQDQSARFDAAGDEGPTIDFRNLRRSIAVGSSASSPLDEVQRTLSRPTSRSSNPISPKRASISRAHAMHAIRTPSAARQSRMSTSNFSFASPRTDADTMSIASSCMTDSMGAGMEDAAARRAKLLQSVQRAMQQKETQRQQQQQQQYHRSRPSFGESITTSGFAAARSGDLKRPANLILKPSHILPPHIISPLTPPETPAEARYDALSSGQGVISSLSMVEEVSTLQGDVSARSNNSTSSLASFNSMNMSRSSSSDAQPHLRPLSLTADASIFDEPGLLLPTSSSGRALASADLGTLVLSQAANSSNAASLLDQQAVRARQLYHSRRQSRGLQAGAGGVLPIVSAPRTQAATAC